MKASQLQTQLNALLTRCDPELVTGDHWLPDPLTQVHLQDNLLFFEFEQALDADEGMEEGLGLVNHEIEQLTQTVIQLLNETGTSQSKAEKLVTLILLAHEKNSADFIEAFTQLFDPS